MAIAGALIGKALGAFGEKPKIPEFPKIRPSEVQGDTVRGNLEVLPGAQDLAAQVNKFNAAQFKQAFEAFLPGFLGQASGVVGSQLRGEIPDDVSSAVQRSSAAQAFGAGFGGSGLGRNLTLRDLGLTSIGLQQQGLSNFGALASLNRTPIMDVSSMFFTPQQRLEFEFQDRETTFQKELLRNQVAAAPDPADVALAREIDRFFNTFASFGMMSLGGLGGAGGGAAPTGGFQGGAIRGAMF